MNFTKWLQFVLGVLPLILQVVSQVERILSGLPGSTKKELAKDIVRDHLRSSGIGWNDDIEGLVDKQIDTSVAINNARGVFETSGGPKDPVGEVENAERKDEQRENQEGLQTDPPGSGEGHEEAPGEETTPEAVEEDRRRSRGW